MTESGKRKKLRENLERALKKSLHADGIHLLEGDEDRFIRKQADIFIEAARAKDACCARKIYDRERPKLMSIYDEGLSNARRAKGLNP